MYKTINNLPIDYEFETKTKKELKLYEVWFRENKEARLREIINYVKESKGFEKWEADYSPHSLKELENWLENNVETEKLSKEDYTEKRNKVPMYIEINDWDLTIKTRSLLVDIGIYFGEVFIHNYKGLEWKQFLASSSRVGGHGHMVITGFGKLNICPNPVLMMQSIGLSIAENTRKGDRLYSLYRIWEEDLK